MARYRVLATSFIENKLCEKDAIIEYTGTAADNLEAVDNSVGAPGDNADGGLYQSQGAADLA